MSRFPVAFGILSGLSLAAVYFAVIIVSTPYLPPATALWLSLDRNWALFLSMILAFGTMMGVRSHSRIHGICPARKSIVLGGSSSVLSSFFSLFSLSLVGCCGLFALWVSAVLGTAAVVSLTELSLPLTLFALAGMIVSTLFMVRSRRSNAKDPVKER